MFFVDFLLLKMLHDKDKLKVVTSHYTSDKIGGVYLSAQNRWHKKVCKWRKWKLKVPRSQPNI